MAIDAWRLARRAVLAGMMAAFGTAGQAQLADETTPRPRILELLGLLDERPFRADESALGKPVKHPFSLSLPVADDLQTLPGTDVPGALFAVDFATADGAFLESIVFTEAKVDLGTEESRAFAMANLLVLKSFPSLKESFPDAKIVGFGPVSFGENTAVHLVGTFDSPRGPILFRHVGLLPEGSDDVIVALINVAVQQMPVRGDAQLADTFTAWTLRTLEFDPPAP